MHNPRAVLRVPETLMAEAARRQEHAPVRAGVQAGVAVAIRILCMVPIRLGNLARIRIGQNLIRPGGAKGPFWLVFRPEEVKNRTPVEIELDASTTALIDTYLDRFRPEPVRGARCDWLFPGEAGEHKTPATLSGQITEQVCAATGVRITVHQFRHAAAAILLRHRPGEYELVRRLLGHQSLATTTRFYTGLEALQATRLFGEIVGQELAQTLGAEAKAKRPGKAGPKAVLAGSRGRR